ncbi:MAG: GNAT family N-acetyltransferase [Candidatus Dechloromonas phosphoritropha]
MLQLVAVDLKIEAISTAWLELLDHYARDPMGGGEGLPDYAKSHLVMALQNQPGFHGALAYDGEQAVGLINCFLGFSTFAGRPLLNIHDVVVHADYRRQGIGQALLRWAEERARELGCCKLTLEILSGNAQAMASYMRAGYAPYVLNPAAGQALLMQKFLPES